MGIAYRNYAARGLSVTVADGILTKDEWYAHVRRQLADPDWPAGPLNLTDTLGSEFTREALAENEAVAQLYLEKAERTRRMQFATVANKNFIDATLFQEIAQANGARMVVFNDLSSACAWLRVDLDEMSTLIEEVRKTI